MQERFNIDKYALKELATGARIITDEETGVQYLFVYSGYAGGLTALLGPDGKPLLNPNFAKAKL